MMAADGMSFDDLLQTIMQLYGEGKFDATLVVLEQHAAEFPEESTRITLWRMCLLSMCKRPQDALSLFQAALDQGLWWHDSHFNDSDLDAIRDLPEFKRLVGISHEKYLQARAAAKPERRILVPDEITGPLPLLIALHGRNGNAETDLARWDVARQRGWLVLSPQSTQPLSPHSYGWDDPDKSLADIRFHYEEVVRDYEIATRGVVAAGFSQGGGMALYAALSGEIPARGFIGIGTWWRNVEDLAQRITPGNRPRAYFVTGGRDESLARIREIQAMLRLNDFLLDEEFHSEIGHVYPPDFARSFEKAIEFIF
jgi:predicted esterase